MSRLVLISQECPIIIVFLNDIYFLCLFQFCQPAGWVLSSQRQQPTFFVSVLTDIDADRHYCACLTFYEPVAMTTKPDDEDLDDHEVIIPHHSQMFAPKSLVLITQHDYFETFRVRMLQIHCQTEVTDFPMSR